MPTTVIDELNELAVLLDQTGKHGPAAKFRDFAQRLADHSLPKRDILRELESCGAIVQYANFTAEEERKLFFGVFPAVEAELAKSPRNT